MVVEIRFELGALVSCVFSFFSRVAFIFCDVGEGGGRSYAFRLFCGCLLLFLAR